MKNSIIKKSTYAAVGLVFALAGNTVSAEKNWLEYADAYGSGKPVSNSEQPARTAQSSEIVESDTAAIQFRRAIQPFLSSLQTRLGANLPDTDAVNLDGLSSQFESVKQMFLLNQGVRSSLAQQLRERNLNQALQDLERLQGQETALFESLFGELETAFTTGELNEEDRSALAEQVGLLLSTMQPSSLAPLRSELLPYTTSQLNRVAPTLTPEIVPAYLTSDVTVDIEDLSASALAPLTDDILLKAQALEYDPIQIFEFVQSEIEVDWYHGAMRGARGTLAQGAGNSEDQAALLIALYRAASIPVRYVRGVIELDAQRLLDDLGLETTNQVAQLLTAAGIPHSVVVRGGAIGAFQLEHTWVAAQVPYANYRGAVLDRSGLVWLPLFPALKSYNYSPANNLLQQANIDSSAVKQQHLASQLPITVLDSVRLSIDQALAGEPREDARRARTIDVQKPGLLPATLPVDVIVTTFEGPQLPEDLIHRVRFVSFDGSTTSDENILDKTFLLPDIASQRITLSYQSGTYEDQRLINVSGGLLNVPSFLVSVRPQIKVAGQPRVIASNPIALGASHLNQIELIYPGGRHTINKQVISGGYEGIAVVAGKVVNNEVVNDPADTEGLAARLLSQIALNYSDLWRDAEAELADYANHTLVQPIADVTFAGNELLPDVLFGRIERLNWQGVNLDAALRVVSAIPVSTDAAATDAFYRLSSLHGSELEHLIFEQDFAVESISSGKAIAIANENGVLVERIDQTNRDAVLPTLSHSANVIQEIVRLLDAGLVVTTPVSAITLGRWTGYAWIAEDTNTGATGYFISRALAGGATSEDFPSPLNDIFENPYINDINPDPEAGALLNILSGGFQFGEVATDSQRLIALVRDVEGRPVSNARVEFFVRSGAGTLSKNGEAAGDEGQSVFATTASSGGLVEAVFTFPESTATNYTYLSSAEGVSPERVGTNYVGIRLVQQIGSLDTNTNFLLFAISGAATQLVADSTVVNTAQNGAIGPVRLVATDEFFNPVANTNVDLAALPVVASGATAILGHTLYVDDTGCPSFPVPSNCGSSALTVQTDFDGSVFLFAVLGVAEQDDVRIPATFPVSASLAGGISPTTINYVTGSAPALSRWSGPGPFAASEPNARYNNQFEVLAESAGSRTARIKSISFDGSPVFAGDVSGLGSDRVTVNAVDVPSSTGFKELSAVIELVSIDDPEDIIELTSSGGVGLTAVDLNLDPLPLLIAGADNRLLPIQTLSNGADFSPTLSYTADPGELVYDPRYAEFIINESGAPKYYLTASGDDLSQGSVELLNESLVFEPGKAYTYEAVYNRGIESSEVSSESSLIEILAPIITSVKGTRDATPDMPDTPPTLLNASSGSLTIDLLNQTTCKSLPRLDVQLNQTASVTLIVDTDQDGEFEPSDLVVLLDQPLSNADVTRLPIDMPSEKQGDFAFQLVATTADGESETQEGEIRFRHLYDYSLPVGHANHAGVDLYNGNLALSRTDINVPGRGRPLEFTRSYSSSRGVEGTMGLGWTHQLDMSIRATGCGKFIISGGDGGGIQFIFDVLNNDFKPTVGYHGSLERNGNEFDFYSKNGTRYHFRKFAFDGSGQWSIEYIEDTNGNRTILGYRPGGTGQLEIVEDSSGRQLRLAYDTVGSAVVAERLTGVSGLDYEVSFTYDDHARLSAATMNSEGIERTEQYEWEVPYTISEDQDAFNKRIALKRITDARGNDTVYSWEVAEKFLIPGQALILPSLLVTQITQRDGGVLKFEYGARAGEVTNSLDTFQSRVTSPRISRTGSLTGAETTYSLNFYGSPIRIESEVGVQLMEWAVDDIVLESTTDEEGRVTNFSHDDNGNQTSEQVEGFAAITSTWQDPAVNGNNIKNLLTSQTDRAGNTTEFEYDDQGNLTKIIHPERGQVAVVLGGSVNFAEQSILTESFSYDANGDRKTATNKRGNLTTFNYDPNGYLIEKTDALGGKMLQVFDDRGRKLEQTDEEGRTTEFLYDGFDRLITITDALDGVMSMTYDNNDNKLSEEDEEGRITRFEYDPENRVELIRDALLSEKRLVYDPNGNLTQETDFRGNTTDYRYDGVNRQVRQTRNCGPVNTTGCVTRTTNISYDDVGNVISESRDDGWLVVREYDDLNREVVTTQTLNGTQTAVTTREYDDHGNLLVITDPLLRTTNFEYDGLNRLVKTIENGLGLELSRTTEQRYDGMDNVIGTIDGNGNIRIAQYDELDRVVRRFDPELNITRLDYDAVGNLIFETDALQRVVQNTYDSLNRVIRRKDATNQTTRFEYDRVDNLRFEFWPSILAGQTVVERTYDALNRPTAESDNEGFITQLMSYDADGNLIGITDGNGNTSEFDYNAFNERIASRLGTNGGPLIQQNLFTSYDRRGNVIQQTNGRGFTTSFEYDLADRLVSTTDARTESAFVSYDVAGNKISDTDFRGNTTTYQFDDFNRLITQIDPDAIDPDTGFSAHPSQLTFEYDLNDNIVRALDKRGFETTNIYESRDLLQETFRQGVSIQSNLYDAVGNLIRQEDANDNSVAFVYSDRNELLQEGRELASVTNYRYDAVGNQILIVDPELRETQLEYDLRRRVVGTTNGEGEETLFTFDNNNNQLTRTRPELNAWTFAYDALNRLETITDPDLGETNYVYDAANNLESQQDARLNTTRFTFDELNRRTQIEYPDGATIEFTSYDPNGNLLTMLDARSITTTYSYDALNRQINRVFTTPADATLMRHIDTVATRYDGNNNIVLTRENYSNGTQHTTTQQYDDFDRMEIMTDPYGRTLVYGYDLNGNRTQLTDPDNLTTSYVYDALNRAVSVTNQQGTTTYDYDRSSLLRLVVYPNGTRSAMAYDQALRTDTITNTLGASSVISSFEYDYDDNGNRIEQREQNGGGVEVTTYDYDALDRLERVTYPDSITTYTYDPAYNRDTELVTSSDGATTLKDLDYVYDPRNQLTDINDQLDPTQNISYTFDGNGNQISKLVDSNTTEFIYDARDNLRQVLTGGSSIGQFLYDDKGMRIEKLGDRGTERYTYDDLSVITQSDASNSTVAKYDYGAARLLSLSHDTEGTQFYLSDALGSVANLTRADGGIQARYQYDAFGNYRAQVGTSRNRFGFTGHEVDTETGLIYFKARFYDPETGRFLSHDAFEGTQDNPPSLHKYLYAFQNPTVYVDPTGNFNEAGHYYLPFIIASRVGAPTSIAAELALYTQLPDEIGYLDAKANTFNLGQGSTERVTGLHVLSGENAEIERENARAIIEVSPKSSLAVIGSALHAFGDGIAHEADGGNTYGLPIGHFDPTDIPTLGASKDFLHSDLDRTELYVRELIDIIGSKYETGVTKEHADSITAEMMGILRDSVVTKKRKVREWVNANSRNGGKFDWVEYDQPGTLDSEETNRRTIDNLKLAAEQIRDLANASGGDVNLLDPERSSLPYHGLGRSKEELTEDFRGYLESGGSEVSNKELDERVSRSLPGIEATIEVMNELRESDE